MLGGLSTGRLPSQIVERYPEKADSEQPVVIAQSDRQRQAATIAQRDL